MKKFFLLLFLMTVSAEAHSSTAQLNYWYKLIASITDLSIIVFFTLGILGFGKLTIVYAMQVLGAAKDSLGRRDMKPMNVVKFMAGVCLCSVLVAPFSLMKLMGDITGLSSGGKPMCFVTDVKASSLSWSENASGCMDHVEQRVLSASGFTEISDVGMDYLKLFFGVIQLSSLVFFGNSISTLLRHVFGYRNIQVSVGGAFGALLASSVLFMLPNAFYYVEDIFGSTPPIISTVK